MQAMESFAAVLDRYDFSFPQDLIAREPASPRDAARLLVYNRAADTTIMTSFRNLQQFLPKGALLVLNETKVIPAKLNLLRSTGGKVSILVVHTEKDSIHVLANRKMRNGEFLQISGKRGFTVQESREKIWILKPNFPMRTFQRVLQKFGSMPLPPYIKHTCLSSAEQKREYQTVFAKKSGSIAAPTASLHFTKRLLKELETSGIEIVKVTLHVHLGTFAPLTEVEWKKGALHLEQYEIPKASAKSIERAIRAGRPIIAVGTTVLRTLESALDTHGRLTKLSGTTDLFIREGYDFRLVSGLITNFHVPKSSLLMLVSAFAGREETLGLYHKAIRGRFRLFSFGDAMLIV